MVGPLRPVFVLFGSSIVEFSFGNGGWGSILADTYARQADVILRGYAGWNSRQALQVLPEIFPLDSPIQPSLVIVYFGGNDSAQPHPSGLSPHVPLEEYIENMRKIGLYITNLSETTRVIFLSCPPVKPSPYDGDRSNKSKIIYSEACMRMCNEMNFKVVDMFNAISTRDNWANTCFLDGIHFSAEASKTVAKAILKTIRDAGWKPSLCCERLPVEYENISP